MGRTHAPRTSRFRCARTRVRTCDLKWSHFAPALALYIFFSNFSTFYDILKQEKDVLKQEKDIIKQEKDVLKQEMITGNHTVVLFSNEKN